MFKKNFNRDYATQQDLEHYKSYDSYKEIIKDELPTNAELKLQNKKQREYEYLKMRSSKKSDPGDFKYRRLEGLVMLDNLKSLPRFEKFFNLLEKPSNNDKKIISEIKRLRESFFNIDMFGSHKVEIIDNKQKYNKAVNKMQLLYAEDQGDLYYGESIEPPEYNKNNIKIKSLYHWVPEELIDTVMKQGLLPGFLTGNNLKPFVFAALERNTFWLYNIDYSRFDIKKPNKFIELEIDYDDSIEAYMWMGMCEKIMREDKHNILKLRDFYRSGWIDEVLSSQLVSLDRQVSELVKHDITMLNLDYWPSDLMNTKTYFSSLIKREIPYYFNSSVGSWGSSEVMLDYVPPERIKIIGDNVIPKL